MPGPQPLPILDRLAAHSEPDGECIVWTGHRRGGYGIMGIRGRKVAVHVAAWTARHGEPPPETPCVLHRCDNRPCWRDDHLFLGTKADNSMDMVSKGRQNTYWSERTHCNRGHEYTEANTRWYRGTRKCRACERENSQAARQRAHPTQPI